MFRSDEERDLPWSERTLTLVSERRFEAGVRRLSPLRRQTFAEMERHELTRRIEGCWQDVARKPLRAQQVREIHGAVMRTIGRQADCLSAQEHALCERMFIAGGRTRLEDVQDLDAANALSRRLLVHVGIEDGVPTAALDTAFSTALEAAFSRPEHARMRMRLFSFAATVSAALYLAGAVDDGAPQRLFAQQVLGESEPDEEALQLARQYLWAGFDCVDYEGGVLLVHPALTHPQEAIRRGALPDAFTAQELLGGMNGVLPQEEALDELLLRAADGALRPGVEAQSVVRDVRLLCKQGAPIEAVRAVMDSLLMVRRTRSMDAALEAMHAGAVRWCGACAVLQ